jgi:hypothetical protein
MSTVVIVWLVIIGLLLLAIAGVGVKVRNTPWLNNDKADPDRPIDLESRRFSD